MEPTEYLTKLRDDTSRYMFLSRLHLDVAAYTQDYPLQPKPWISKLFSGNTEQQIVDMKYLHGSVPVVPEWLTMDEILEFERKMTELDLQIPEKVNN